MIIKKGITSQNHIDMTTRLTTAAVVTVCLLALCACAEGLTCAGCAGVCPPAPTDCPLSREPCGCCDICALHMGERCHGWSAGCGPGLMCLTPVGPFPERPPPETSFHGRCVLSSIPNYTPPTPPAPTMIVPTLAPTTIAPTIASTTPAPTTPISTIEPKVAGGAAVGR